VTIASGKTIGKTLATWAKPKVGKWQRKKKMIGDWRREHGAGSLKLLELQDMEAMVGTEQEERDDLEAIAAGTQQHVQNTISFEEFSVMVNGEDGSKNEDDLKKTFATFDENGDGYISAIELKHAMMILVGKGLITPEDVDHMVDTKLKGSKPKLTLCHTIKLAFGCFNDTEIEWFKEREIDDANVDDEIILEPALELSTFDDFEEMAIQFGYLSLFAPAYPMAPLLALLKNIYEIRADSVSFCTMQQRPVWKACEDIGSWFTVLNIIGFVGVMTNATMVTFVSSRLTITQDDRDYLSVIGDNTISTDNKGFNPNGDPEADGIWTRIYSPRLWIISIMFEHMVMLMRIAILSFAPAVPAWTTDAADIRNYRLEKWKHGIESMKEKGMSLEEIQQEVAIGVVKEEDLSVGKQQMDKKQEVQKLVESMATGLVTLTVGNMDPHLSHKINKSMLHIFHGHEESVHEHSNPHGMDHHPTDGQY
jgi:Ca2+-binding EF-hand superfamily protein